MRTQLPAIIQFVTRNGDMGAVRQMESSRSVLDAANIWGRKVERFGINDVHSQGIALATSIMNGSGSAVAHSSGSGPGGGKHLANGGTIGERVLGIGKSGRIYHFGESGRETVIPENVQKSNPNARLEALLAHNNALLEQANRIAQYNGQQNERALGGVGRVIR